jgi:hypothetical protein
LDTTQLSADAAEGAINRLPDATNLQNPAIPPAPSREKSNLKSEGKTNGKAG